MGETIYDASKNLLLRPSATNRADHPPAGPLPVALTPEGKQVVEGTARGEAVIVGLLAEIRALNAVLEEIARLGEVEIYPARFEFRCRFCGSYAPSQHASYPLPSGCPGKIIERLREEGT
jgi:hypothetical protein